MTVWVVFMVAVGAGGLWLALRMVEQDREEFRRTCAALNAEPVFGDPWMCVRDHEPVYVEGN